MDEDRKVKRAAANVNERRRMQNINSGFEALRDLLDVPNKAKLSKSSILRHSVDMVRNLLSENRQLQEQNLFLRNLYSVPATTGPSTMYVSSSDGHDVQNSKRTHSRMLSKTTTSECFVNDTIISPSKKIQLSDDMDNRHTSTPKRTDSFKSSVPDGAVLKANRKLPPHVTKLLSSPKRLTRSSVITQNYGVYTKSPPLFSSSVYPVMESPTRRSLRIQEREQLLTPPPSLGELSGISGVSICTGSPNSKTKRVNESCGRTECPGLHLTPESVKNIPVRSAKRSLDAIIEAIDRLEGT